MKLNKDLDLTNIQQMCQKPNKNPTNKPKTQQESNNPSEKPNKNPTKKPNIGGRCWVLGSPKNPTKNPTFCWICWILVGFFFVGLPTPASWLAPHMLTITAASKLMLKSTLEVSRP